MTEKELIYLVEDRGVGMFPFKDVIDNIVTYTQNMLSQMYKTPYRTIKMLDKRLNKEFTLKKYEFNIPMDYIKQIDWIDRFYIEIIINDYPNYVNVPQNGSGYFDYPKYNTLKDGKINGGKIEVTANSINGKILPRTIYQTLYHELNHAYENYKRLKTNNKEQYLSTQMDNTNYDNLIYYIKYGDVDVSNAAKMLYYLHPTELKANVSSVFGDLKSISSKSWKNDLNNVKAIEIYNNISKHLLPSLISTTDDTWDKIKKQLELKINKNQLIKKIQFALTDFLHRIHKAASLYYDSINEIMCYKDSNMHPMLEYEEYNFTILDQIKEEFDKWVIKLNYPIDELNKNRIY